jgi:hypothetical protein
VIDIEAIKARLQAATPGPWENTDPRQIRHAEPNIYAGDQEIADAYSLGDSELIAHAPADIAALVKELEAARAFIEEAEYAASHDCEEPIYTLQTALSEYERAISE